VHKAILFFGDLSSPAPLIDNMDLIAWRIVGKSGKPPWRSFFRTNDHVVKEPFAAYPRFSPFFRSFITEVPAVFPLAPRGFGLRLVPTASLIPHLLFITRAKVHHLGNMILSHCRIPPYVWCFWSIVYSAKGKQHGSFSIFLFTKLYGLNSPHVSGAIAC